MNKQKGLYLLLGLLLTSVVCAQEIRVYDVSAEENQCRI